MTHDECTSSPPAVNWWSNDKLPRPLRGMGESALGFPVNDGLEETPAKLCGYCDWRF